MSGLYCPHCKSERLQWCDPIPESMAEPIGGNCWECLDCCAMFTSDEAAEIEDRLERERLAELRYRGEGL